MNAAQLLDYICRHISRLNFLMKLGDEGVATGVAPPDNFARNTILVRACIGMGIVPIQGANVSHPHTRTLSHQADSLVLRATLILEAALIARAIDSDQAHRSRQA